MTGDLINLFSDATTVGSALGYLNILPPAVKDRLMSGCNFIIGRGKRRFDVRDKREDAEIADEEKRAGNKTTAEQKVLDTLVPDIAKRIAGDEALMERALVSVMGGAYRKQENKEAVVEECLKDIEGREGDVSSNLDPLDEDWLDIFSSYAEKANTERTRQLWGRILSGEVRNPGQFSLKTLRLLSEIDKETAEIFVEKCSLLLDDINIMIGTKEINLDFEKWKTLEEAGLMTGTDGSIFLIFPQTKDRTLSISAKNIIIKAQHISGVSPSIPCISLTKTGKELLNIIECKEDVENKIRIILESINQENCFDNYSVTTKN